MTYNPDDNVFFVNFEGLPLEQCTDCRYPVRGWTGCWDHLGKKVYHHVNYETSQSNRVEDEYINMVKYVVETYYLRNTVYDQCVPPDEAGRCLGEAGCAGLYL